jgi:hypothetical protein
MMNGTHISNTPASVHFQDKKINQMGTLKRKHNNSALASFFFMFHQGVKESSCNLS